MAMEHRSASAERGSLVSLWGLLGLFIVKGSVGWLTGSKALMADACQSAADCAGTVTSYMGIRKARMDPKAVNASRHNPESVAAIVLSAMLLVAGIEIGISSARSIANGVEEAPGVGAVIVIAAGIGVREGLVRYRRSRDIRCGIRVDRTLDGRSDIFVSLTALVGTSGAVVGELYDMPGLYVLDPAAGLVISLIVVRMGYRMTAGVLRVPDHCKLEESDAQSLLEAVQRVDGVVAVDDVKAREQGHYIVLDIVIRVNPRISVFEGQDIAHRVRRQLTKRFLHVMDANVKVQPYDPGFPYKSNHQEEELSSLIQ
ncbi:cation diffusion facilitator family transporter [Cohnella lupini]|uniref:Cation diffusion facilitator family transporter n=1 Tax=Cohnella lupini TaxID=1294267 RepID=A0A3D9IR71_9BACL|nr:cation diffusion facilitator family transporter [Cohnella lupini]RED64148.1 cation diffusion facilitator family transporter [Cohnella lupini]